MTQSVLDLSNEPLTTDCLLRHGLERQPFDAIAGDTFLYTDPTLDMVVGVLLEHLRNDDSLLLLKGETGAGKSTQLLRLLSRGAESFEFCAFKARAGTNFAAVEHTIRQYWKRAAEDDELLPLDELVCRIAQGGRRPVIVVDDAHHLNSAILAQLSRLRREVRRRCDVTPGLLLVGEPYLEINLEQTVDDDTPAEPHISVQLRPLTREQTEAYLRRRLQAAGAADPDLLCGEAAAAIHQASGGLPLQINAAANRRLESQAPVAADSATTERRSEYPRPVQTLRDRWLVPATVVILGVVALAILVRIVASPDKPPETRELLVLPEPRPLSAPATAEAPPEAPRSGPEIRFDTPADPADPPHPSLTAPDTAPQAESGADTPADSPAPAALAEAVPESSPQAAPEASPEAEPVPTPEAQPRETPAPVTEAARDTGDSAALRDTVWLREQPAGHYTIQILALSDLQSLRRYGREQGIDMELAWFRTVRDGRDWYVLVAGHYADAEAARAAIAGLPEAVRENKPWVRSFGSIQEAMASAR